VILLKFQQINPHSCRTYVLGDEGSSEVVLIDPVLEHFNDYLDYFKKSDLKLERVIDTHTHSDHISAGASLRDITGCDYMMHKSAPAGCVTIKVQEGFEFSIGDIPVKVIETFGHTKDSISLILSDRIFTGDALFLDDGGAGRNDLPGGDPNQHWDTLIKYKSLPENLVVYPAHDYRNRQPSELANQKRTNPHLICKTKKEFLRYIKDLSLGSADWMKDVLKANYACARDPKTAWIPCDLPACEIQGTYDHGVNDIVVENISPESLKEILGIQEDLVLLDVRQDKELKGKLGHLDGIVHIPINELTGKLEELEKYKDHPIVTICKVGARSYTAARILKQTGFGNVKVLAGGMKGWRKTFGDLNG
jgi:glyoxylase-like metal-dependent hydrolase (beta-lactamase superfamily II)